MRSQRLVLGLMLAAGAVLVGLALWLTIPPGATRSPGFGDEPPGDPQAVLEANGGRQPTGESELVVPHRVGVDRDRVSRRAGMSHETAKGRLVGRVESLYGEPVSGARVEIVVSRYSPSLRSASSLQVETDGDGRFAATVPLGAPLLVTARAEDYVPQTLYSVSAGDDLVFVLEEGARLAGIVIDDETGFPVGGACVTTRVGSATVSCRTTADGQFELTDLRAGAVSVQVVAPGYERADYRNLVVGQSMAAQTELRLVPGDLLAGIVLDAATGAAIAQAKITYGIGKPSWSQMGLADPFGVQLVQHSDARGGFVFERVGLEDATLLVEADGYAPRTVRGNELLGGREAGSPVEVRLVAAIRLEGVVLAPDGAVAAGASVTIGRNGGPPVTTGEDGHFVIGGLDPSASVRITATHPLYAPAELTKARADEVPRPLELILVEPAQIRGQVLGPERKPEPDVRVTLQGIGRSGRLPGGYSRLATSDQDGRFTYDVLVPGDYQLTARGGRSFGEPLLVPLEAGETKEVVVSTMAALAVRGRVIDSSGLALAGVRLDAVEKRPAAPGSSGNSSQERRLAVARAGVAQERRVPVQRTYRTGTFSDPEGLFVIQGFVPGTQVRINAHRPGYGSRLIDTVAGATDVMVILDRFVTFEGRVVDVVTQKPVPSFSIELARDDPASGAPRNETGRRPAQRGARWRGNRPFTDPEGRFVLDRLVPGAYRIRARSPDHRVGKWNQVTVTGDRSSGPVVTLALSSASIIKGQVLTADGAPAPRVNVYLLPVRSRSDAPARVSTRRHPGASIGRTDGAGIYRFRDMRPGPYEVCVGSPDDPVLGPFAVTAIDGRIVERDLRLPPLPSLQVEVTDDQGRAVERAAVRIRMVEAPRAYYSARTDAKGVARFQNLLPGDYKISSYSRQGRSGERSLTIAGAGIYHESLEVSRLKRR